MFGFNTFSEGIETLLLDLPNWIMLLTALIGLRGYIYTKPYFISVFWRAFTPVFVLWSAFYFAYIWQAVDAQGFNYVAVDMLMLSIVFLAVPQVWGLIQYSYYKKSIW